MSINDDVEKIKKLVEEEGDKKVTIALFGQPGAGKSSLINSIIGKNSMLTGQATDITKEAKIVEHNSITFVDLPGYGTSKFPPNEWFKEFNPDQYDLFLCVFANKFHEADSNFFNELKSKKKPCLFVRNKYDDLWQDGKTLEELEAEIVEDVSKHVNSREKVYFTSCRQKKGIDKLQIAIEESLEPVKREKFVKYSKAYSKAHLEEKKAQAEKTIAIFASLSAANGLNPIPGVDISIDIGILYKLFVDLREVYGLNEKKLNSVTAALIPLAKDILMYSTREGLLVLLKQYATKQALKTVSKWIPLVGTVIAGLAGFTITYGAGMAYLNDCHDMAVKIFEDEFGEV